MTLDGDFTPEEFDKARRAEAELEVSEQARADLMTLWRDANTGRAQMWKRAEAAEKRVAELETESARRAEDTFAPVHVDAQVYRDLDDEQTTEEEEETPVNQQIPDHLPECRPDEGWCVEGCPRFPFIVEASKGPDGNPALTTNPHSPGRERRSE